MRVKIAGMAMVLGIALLGATPHMVQAQAPAKARAVHQPRREYVLFFDLNSAAVTPRGERIVAQAVAAIEARQKANTLSNIKVIGYSDTADTNDQADQSLKLSADRANAVRDQLVAKGVNTAIISTEGRGKRDLAVRTGEHVSNIRNRRVRIVMFAPGE